MLTDASGLDGYSKWTFRNSISPISFGGIIPWSSNIFIFDWRSIIGNTYPPEPNASANDWIFGIKLPNENVAVKQDIKI